MSADAFHDYNEQDNIQERNRTCACQSIRNHQSADQSNENSRSERGPDGALIPRAERALVTCHSTHSLARSQRQLDYA